MFFKELERLLRLKMCLAMIKQLKNILINARFLKKCGNIRRKRVTQSSQSAPLLGGFIQRNRGEFYHLLKLNQTLK